ncbi:DUF167 family protein [Pseudaminobacter sp. NGMCC 1.201702]|uniref:DUF167 family protein n=1 Tax=Pseudaminobacter sp. NGMCC 1.201702 TaxID=3391825 RepID=UPI0039EE4DBA
MSGRGVNPFFRAHENGVDLFVRLTPRAAKDAIGAVSAGADGRNHLGAHVRAVPEKGAANAALERLVAACLDVPRSMVAVVAGGTARLKTVRVTGDPKSLAKRLEKLTAPDSDTA